MRTRILLLLVAACAGAQATTNLDSLRRAAFRPVMDVYILKVNDLTGKIRNSTNPDSIKTYAKQLMRASDEMEKNANAFYNYKGMQVAPAILLTNPPSYGVAMVSSGDMPDAARSANKIWDCASNIRFSHCRHPEKIKKNLEKIDKVIGGLSRW